MGIRSQCKPRPSRSKCRPAPCNESVAALEWWQRKWWPLHCKLIHRSSRPGLNVRRTVVRHACTERVQILFADLPGRSTMVAHKRAVFVPSSLACNSLIPLEWAFDLLSLGQYQQGDTFFLATHSQRSRQSAGDGDVVSAHGMWWECGVLQFLLWLHTTMVRIYAKGCLIAIWWI